MRLTALLLRVKNPNGHLFRGKDRLVKQVTGIAIFCKRRDLQREEENMFLLRHPYLTVEQSHGHAQALQKSEKRMERLKMMNVDFKPHIRLEDRLAHLRVTESWD